MNEKALAVTVGQLQVFSAVAELEHVTRAADNLSLSQPSVSHQLKTLERVLGLHLFERVGRGLRLTTDGRALIPTVEAALAGLRAVEEAAAARGGLIAGDLTVAASNTIGIYRMPVWLPGFVDTYPGINVRVRLVNTHEAIQLLQRAEVDCALIEGPGTTSGFEELPVERDELMVVAAADHPLSAQARVSVADLARHRYLAREPGSGTEALAAELLGSAYRSGQVHEFGQVAAVRTATLAGLGYAVLPMAAIEDDLAAGRLRRLPTRRSSLKRILGALRRRTAPSPTLDAFWSHLREISTVE
jgi:DNA-binding transcriptional LysR family regulator